MQFDEVFDSVSDGGIFDSLMPFCVELWQFENFKFLRNLQPTQNYFLKIFLSIGRVKNSSCTGLVFIDFHKYNDLE